MFKAPKNTRLHIGIFGRRNVGKSSILNALVSQDVSIVSDIAGTTTDPVEKAMELLPLGPVLFIDTAGIDDEGVLGSLRVNRTRQVLDRVDLAVIVTAAGEWGAFEDQLAQELRGRNVPVIAVFNKSDLAMPSAQTLAALSGQGIHIESTCAPSRDGIAALRAALIKKAPDDFFASRRIIGDLVPPGECAVLVVPIDKEAPKGRIILPQVQVIRDLLDNGSFCCVARDSELAPALKRMASRPSIVVTDSQAFAKVAAEVPDEIPLTSFSILFARYLGDLKTMVAGACAIDTLRPSDTVLIAEACSHHPIEEDIGTRKIPAWLTKRVGGNINFVHARGHDFPADVRPYKLVIHCGACMWNRREMLSRIELCKQAGVPITNYGLTIAYSLGIFERALGPFPGVLGRQ